MQQRHFGYNAFYSPDLVVMTSMDETEEIAKKQMAGTPGNLMPTKKRPLFLASDCIPMDDVEVANVWISEALDQEARNAAAKLAERIIHRFCYEDFDEFPEDFSVTVLLEPEE